MRNAASDCESDVDKAATELSLDRPTYDALTRLNVSRADAATQYYVSKTIRDFRRAGVDKDEAARARIKALREELVKLGQQFRRTSPPTCGRSSSIRPSSTACPTTSSARTRSTATARWR